MKNIIYLFVFTLVFTSCGDDPFSKVKTENVEQAALRDNSTSKFPVMTFDKNLHDFKLDLGISYLENEPILGVEKIPLYKETYLL